MKQQKLQNKDLNLFQRFIRGVAIICFWLLIWQLVSMAVSNVLFLPSPIAAFTALGHLLTTKTFYFDVIATVYRCIMGILLSFISGLMLAVLSYKFNIVRTALGLPVNFLKVTPVMAIAIYALLILTSGNVPIFVCFLICFPIVYINVLSGLDNMEEDYLEMAQIFKISEYSKFKWIYAPSIGPEIKASLDLIAGLSWKSIVAAEVLAVPDFSMGYNLMSAKYYLETPSLFAWVIAIVAFSYGFERLIRLLLKNLDFKEYQKSKIKWRTPKQKKLVSSPSGITISNISKSFEDKVIFHHLSMVFGPDTVTAVMAPSGYGKTTLLRLISGLDKPDAGTISVSGAVSYLFQEDRLLPWLNICDNLSLVLRDKVDKEEGLGHIEKILKTMELWQDRYKLPTQLSGGMRHRTAMARAFLYPSAVLLLDEPFKGLDEDLKKRIIKGTWSRAIRGKTVLLVTHNREDAKALTDSTVDLAES